MPKRTDLTGQTIGDLTVIRFDGHHNNRIMYLCRSECGTEVRVTAQTLHRRKARPTRSDIFKMHREIFDAWHREQYGYTPNHPYL